MKFEKPVPVKWLAEFTGAELIGNDTQQATGINEIHKVTTGDISFVDFEKYYDKCLQSAATIIIINKAVDCPTGKTLLVTNDPFSAYVKIVNHFRPFEPANKMISDSATIGKGTHIQPGVFVGNHVTIGENCLIHPNVTIYDHTVIGNNVIIQAGCILGADAFYFKRRKDREVQYDKLLSCGRVIIEDDVEIGAGTTIDKGVSGDTIIGQGTKLDNHIHIGHGAVIGKNCLFAGMQQLFFEVPVLMTPGWLEEQVLRTVSRNKAEGLCRVRLQVYAGGGGLYSNESRKPFFVIECFPLEEDNMALNENGLTIGISTGIAKTPDTLANLKSCNALIYAVAAKQAKAQQWNDALICNTNGHIIESTIANLFWVKDGILYTPPLSDGCIAGVMRRHIMTLTSVTEKSCTADDLLHADEMFLTNAIKRIRWVATMGDKRYTNTTSTTLFSRL